MPVIDMQVKEVELIDAHVTLSFTRLTDLLTRVINQTNTHDADIEFLKKRLQEEKGRGDELELLLKGGRGRQKSLADTAADLDQLKNELEALRNEIINNKSKEAESLMARLNALEKLMDVQVTKLDKETKESRDNIAKHTDQIDDIGRHLDSLNIPDIKPIEDQLRDLDGFRCDAVPKLNITEHFIQAWSADPAKLEAVCLRNKAGNFVQPVEARTEYILSLPPFDECNKQYKACDEFNRAALEAKLQHMRDGKMVNGDINKGDLAQLSNEIKVQQQAVKNALDFLDRRLKDADNIPGRVSALENQTRGLGIQKADTGLLNNKADADKNIGLARQVSDLRNDVNDIFDRLVNQDKKGIISPQQSSSARRISNAVANDSDIRRRLGDLEVETGRLEARKANRDELDRLYKLVDAADPDAIRFKSLQATGRPYTNGSSGDGSLPGITPQRPSTTDGRPSTGDNDYQSPRRNISVGDSGVPETNVEVKAIRTETTTYRARSEGSRQSTPVRVFLGRSVAIVRDNGGNYTPASIGMIYH